MRRAISTALISIAASGAAIGVVAADAVAMSAPIQITQNVNMRSGPGTSYARVGGIYAGQSPDFICWAVGENINGVNVWFDVNANGSTGYYASYYDNSSYATDALITSKYGIPQCGTQPPSPAPAAPTVNPQPPTFNPQPPTVNPQGPTVNPQAPTPSPAAGSGTSPAPSGPSAAENAAVAWARPYANSRSGQFQGLCLTFVDRAYAHAGVSLRNEITVRVTADTYPLDIWGRFSGGRTGTGTPPFGALVFFEPKSGSMAHRRYDSHVALSLGGGTLISTADSVATPIHYESMTQHNYAHYLGWWLPA